MSLLSTYLVFVQGSSDKYYDIAVNTNSNKVYSRYGRRGTTQSEKLKDFPSPSEAVKFFHNQVRTKLNKGYLIESRPSSAPNFPVEIISSSTDGQTQIKTPDQPAQVQTGTPENYTLTWRATSKSIKPAHILKAYNIVKSVLEITGNQFPDVEIKYCDEELGPHVKFKEANKIYAQFGYPSDSFSGSLTRKDRNSLKRGSNMEANNWLTTKGKGSGIIFTHKKRIDFFIRLFFSVLQAKGGVFVACSEQLPVSSKGLNVTNSFSSFEWFPFWEKILYQASRTFWLIKGEGIFLPPEQTLKGKSQELTGQYAW